MVRRKGVSGFTRVSWDQALDLVAAQIRYTDPRRISFYLTSRGITNEVSYLAQKVARFLGTNSVDNSSRACHAPSTTGVKDTLGVASSTCSYTDWLGTDLLITDWSQVRTLPGPPNCYTHCRRRSSPFGISSKLW